MFFDNKYYIIYNSLFRNTSLYFYKGWFVYALIPPLGLV